MTKYIFVTGGVVSGLGKGITAASLGRLLKSRGIEVTIAKLDPYINVDPGTMSPLQHGEVFVTDDGAETDLDLGHYERFLDVSLTRLSNVTTGKIYWSILEKERRGDFLGSTVQVIPHVTNEIKGHITEVANATGAQVVIIEIGGTVGDIESLPFLEAIRQMKTDVGRDACLYVHVTLVPYVGAGEPKTKPTQHSVKELRALGIQPDIIVCRTEKPLSEELKKKIGLFCDIAPEAVIPNIDADSIYEVPLLFEKEGLDDLVLERLNLGPRPRDLSDWRLMVDRIKNPLHDIKVGIVGKYTALPDAYMSITEALDHAGAAYQTRVEINWIDSDALTGGELETVLKGVDAVVVPSGFGSRGVEGKVDAARFCRTYGVPFLGIGMGMHCAIIEFARNVCGLTGANSTEFDADTDHPVVILSKTHDTPNLGGTMRLGLETCVLQEGSHVRSIYNAPTIRERHRNRYEFNMTYRDVLQDGGMTISGLTEDGKLAEVVELSSHPWFVGCQFHPEFRSRPNRPHPLFQSLVLAALKAKGLLSSQTPSVAFVDK